MGGPSRWTCGRSSSESSPFPYHARRLTLRASAANLPPDCINLGQGYMNFPPPVWARDAAEEALRSVEGNHYSPAKGRLRLRNANKEFYGMQFGSSPVGRTKVRFTSSSFVLFPHLAHLLPPSRPSPTPSESLCPPAHASNAALLCMLKASWCRAIRCVHGVHRTRRRSRHLRALLRPVPAVDRLPRRQVRLRSPPPQLRTRPERQDWEAVMDD